MFGAVTRSAKWHPAGSVEGGEGEDLGAKKTVVAGATRGVEREESLFSRNCWLVGRRRWGGEGRDQCRLGTPRVGRGVLVVHQRCRRLCMRPRRGFRGVAGRPPLLALSGEGSGGGADGAILIDRGILFSAAGIGE